MSLTQHRTTVVAFSGELDLASVPAMRGALRGATGLASRLVIDLSAVTFIDSVGIGAVLRAAYRAGLGSAAVVLAPDSYARVLFEMVGADQVVPVYATREEAVAALDA